MTYHVSAKIDELYTCFIHIPAYVKDLRVRSTGRRLIPMMEKSDGYLYISREWGRMIRWNSLSTAGAQNLWRVRTCARTSDAALMRGPVVYCLRR